MRESDREREGESEGQRERDREREGESEGQREREGERHEVWMLFCLCKAASPV